MANFDPDAFLAKIDKSGGFDPDAFLAKLPANEAPKNISVLDAIKNAAFAGGASTAYGLKKLLGEGINAVGTGFSGDWRDKEGNLVNQNALQRLGKGMIQESSDVKSLSDKALEPYKEAYPWTVGGTKLASEILTTLPVGSSLAKTLEGGAGLLGAGEKVSSLANALRTSGMKTGANLENATRMQKLGDLGIRTAGAAGTGGVTASILDPENAGVATAISAAAPAVFKGFGAAGGGLNSLLIKPFTEKGQAKIVTDAISRFAENPTAAWNNIRSSSPIIEGSMPSTIAASGDTGLAGLGRTMQSSSPQYANELTALNTAQNQARTSAMEGIAGNTGKIDIAKAARDEITDPMRDYVLSNAKHIETKRLVSEIESLMSKPDNAGELAQSALGNVRKSLLRIGENGAIDPRSLYAIRKDINDVISGKLSGEAGNAKFASKQLIGVKNIIDDAIDNASRQSGLAKAGEAAPIWKQYLNTYTEQSKPINQMEALDNLFKRIQTGTTDTHGSLVLSPAKLNNILKNESSDLSKNLTPEQFDLVRKLSADLNASNLSQNAGKSVGSNTVQNLAGNQALTGLIGDKLGGSVMSRSLAGRLLKLPYGSADKMMKDKLAEALISPQAAIKYAEKANEVGQIAKLLRSGNFAEPLIYRGMPAAISQ